MKCPECNSGAVRKEITRRGWSGDYQCVKCGFSNTKDAFAAEPLVRIEVIKVRVKKKIVAI